VSQIFTHVLFDQFEGRTSGSDTALRWDAQGWIGTDMNRLWLKSEGFLSNGAVSDGDVEAFTIAQFRACGISTRR
jgi:copper resistance protein B